MQRTKRDQRTPADEGFAAARTGALAAKVPPSETEGPAKQIKPRIYWSTSLQRSVIIPEDDERFRIDELLKATDDLLAAIQLTGLAPSDPATLAVWNEFVARATRAVQVFKPIKETK